ncbi:MAG TPA: GGDEF domain-containing protein [Anaerolineales bacterium]|nr:GGDEF domain-containing protein [Anaerolineales bacterium]
MFDVRTAALLIVMTFLVQATAIGAQAFLIRELKQYQGVEAAVGANLCMAVGLILRLFVDRLPDFIDTILANALLLMGLGLSYAALSQFTGLRYSKALVSVVIAAVLAFLWYFTYWEEDVRMRMAILSLGVVAMLSILVHQLWQTRKTSLRFSADLMLISFLIFGIFMIGRAISIALNPPQGEFSNTPIQSATYLFSFAMSFFWSTGFILMVSQRLRNDLLEVATIDILTRIPNRRAMQMFLEKELARSQRNKSEFSVLLIDIDHFKQVNDRWGHTVGDDVLGRMAGILHSMLRKQDMLARWGGDEFLVIAPGAPDCDPEALAERLRSEVANSEYHHANASFHITVSIGVACAGQASTLDEILKKADEALYRAKRTRNAVSVTNEEKSL